MGRQNTPDLEALVRMLQRPDSSIGTNGAYNSATSDYFNDALAVPTVPNTPNGEKFESEETSNPSINTKHHGSDTGFGNALPYYQVSAELRRFQGEDVGTPVVGPSTPRSGSVLNFYISNWAWDRNSLRTPTLASGSSRSDSGRSEETIPAVGLGPTHENHRLRSHNHQIYHSALNSEGSGSPRPPPKPLSRIKERRPQRASEIQKDNSTCFCLLGCEKPAEDGSRQPLSFTRVFDLNRHYNSKHNDDAEIFHCPDCSIYNKTRLDKVRKHWHAKHAAPGKVFKVIKTRRVVPDRLRGRVSGTWG